MESKISTSKRPGAGRKQRNRTAPKHEKREDKILGFKRINNLPMINFIGIFIKILKNKLHLSRKVLKKLFLLNIII